MSSNKNRIIENPYAKSRKRPRPSQSRSRLPIPSFKPIDTESGDEKIGDEMTGSNISGARNQEEPNPTNQPMLATLRADGGSAKPPKAAAPSRPISPPLTYNPYSKSRLKQKPVSPNTTSKKQKLPSPIANKSQSISKAATSTHTTLSSPTRSVSPPLTYNPYSKSLVRNKQTASTTPANTIQKPTPKRNHPTQKNSSISQDASALIISASDKAGMEGIDRSQIDAIILRESGNSLYMQQQKRRDAKVNERIAQMQTQKEAILKSSGSGEPNTELERQLQSWQAACPSRATKVVVDMDMFYMACELLTKPHLDKVPACVGRGMVLTSNYKARQYGVRSAMAGYIADKLVEELSNGTERLVHVPSTFGLYKEKSLQVKEVLREYDPHMKSYSLDEAYLDLGPYLALYLEHCYGSSNEEQDGGKSLELNDSIDERISESDTKLGAELSDDLHRSIRDTLAGRMATEKSESASDDTKAVESAPREPKEQSRAAQESSSTDEEGDDGDDEMVELEQVVEESDLDGGKKEMSKEEIKCRVRHHDYMKVLKKYPVDICNQAIQTVVHHMRAQVKIRTGGLTCSAGMAPYSGLAKMASDINKPNGQLLVDPHKVLEFLHPLAVRKVPGIGRVTQKILQHVLQVETVQDLYKQRGLVKKLFKQASANYLLKASVGHIGASSSTSSDGGSFASFGTNREEINDEEDHQKGMSRERTFRPESNYQALLDKLDSVADMLSEDLKRKNLKAHTITVKAKLFTFDVFSRAKSLDRNVYIQDADELKVVAKELFANIKAELASKHAQDAKKSENRDDAPKESYELCCRLLGIRCSSLMHEDALPQQKPMDKFLTRTNKSSSFVKTERGQEDRQKSGSETLSLPTTKEKENIISSNSKSDKDPPVELECNTCPLCNTAVVGDNDALNRHIDTCLNASTVRQVVREVTQCTQEEALDSKKKASQKQKLTDFW